MRVDVPAQNISIEVGEEWILDPSAADVAAHLGIYLRSVAYGIYLNVRKEGAGKNVATMDGLLALLRAQAQDWGRAIDEWTLEAHPLAIVGGSFEAEKMESRDDEVIAEVFVTDGRTIANLVGPVPRAVAVQVRPSVQNLAKTIRFG